MSRSHSSGQGTGKSDSPEGPEDTVIRPHRCERCKEVADSGQNTALSALWSSGATVKGQQSEWRPPLCCHMEHMCHVGEALHCKVMKLTFQEQSTWFPSATHAASLAAPGPPCGPLRFPARLACSDSHPDCYSSLASTGHWPSGLEFASMISLINVKPHRLPMTSWDFDCWTI